MSWRQAGAWVGVFALLAAASLKLIDGPPRAGGEAPSPAAGRERKARVLRAVDGDTIVARDDDGRVERVRYIGVDTPESVKPGVPVQCYAERASEFNRRLVEGREVTLVPDREAHDKYGRSLAYVYLGDTMVEALELERGLARTFEFPPNTRHAGYFAALEQRAIRTGRGLWKACGR